MRESARPFSLPSITVILAATLIAAAALALLAVVSPALAHHPTYSAETDCDGNFSAVSTYIGGGGRRLILISEVKVNGAPYQAVWSNNSADPPPNDSGDGGTPSGTNRVIAYNSYGGPKPSAMGPALENFLWVGVDDGWTVFDRSGIGFLPGAANWTGTITQYDWNGSSWVQGGGDPSQALVTEPPAPTNCTSTPPPTPQPTPTPTAPPTPTPSPTPVPTPTPTTPPTPPPTPTATAGLTATPTSPPCMTPAPETETPAPSPGQTPPPICETATPTPTQPPTPTPTPPPSPTPPPTETPTPPPCVTPPPGTPTPESTPEGSPPPICTTSPSPTPPPTAQPTPTPTSVSTQSPAPTPTIAPTPTPTPPATAVPQTPTATPVPTVEAAVQAPGSLPTAGSTSGPLDLYWQQFALLIGGAVAALGIAMVLAAFRRTRP